MVNLLDQLKSEGYDVSGVTSDLIKQLKSEGYDTASIEQPVENKPLYQKIADVENKAGDAISKVMNSAPMQYAQHQMEVGQGPLMTGLQNIPGQITNLMNKSGENVTTALAQGAPNRAAISPEIAAGIGTGVQMIPHATMAAQAISDVPALAKALQNASQPVTSTVGSGVGKLRNMARILMGPGETTQQVAMQPIRNSATGYVDQAREAFSMANKIPNELAQAKAELPQVQARMAKLPAEREALITKAGKNIQSLEAPLGPLDSQKIQQLTSNPQTRSSVLKDLTNLTSKGPGAVNSKMTAYDIRQMRQFVQEVARNPEITIEAAQASKINTVLGEAMDSHIPGYKDALDLYKTAQEALDDIPNIKAQQLGDLRSKIKNMESAFTNSKLNAADSLKKAQLNAKQIIQKADMMVQQGKLSDVYRNNLYKGIVATGILGGASKIIDVIGRK